MILSYCALHGETKAIRLQNNWPSKKMKYVAFNQHIPDILYTMRETHVLLCSIKYNKYNTYQLKHMVAYNEWIEYCLVKDECITFLFHN